MNGNVPLMIRVLVRVYLYSLNSTNGLFLELLYQVDLCIGYSGGTSERGPGKVLCLVSGETETGTMEY